jgi:hypothetical protein
VSLEKQSLGRFARFAANDARSYQNVVQHLEKSRVQICKADFQTVNGQGNAGIPILM